MLRSGWYCPRHGRVKNPPDFKTRRFNKKFRSESERGSSRDRGFEAKRDSSTGQALRPYQVEAAKEISKALKQGKSVLLCMPTGTGKTRTALEALRDYEFSVFTRTINEYYPWENEARVAGVLFGGLVGKARVCQHPIQTFEFLGVKRFVYSACIMKSDRGVERCEFNPSQSDQLVQTMQRKGVLEFARGVPGKWCGYFVAREYEGKMKLYTYPVYFFLKKLLRDDLRVFDEFHNLMEINSLLEVSVAKDELQGMKKIVEKVYNDGTSEQKNVAEKGLAFLVEVENWLDSDGPPPEPDPDSTGELTQVLSDFYGSLPPDAALNYEEKIGALNDYLSKIREQPDIWKKYPDQKRPGRYRIRPLDPAYLLKPLNDEQWIGLSGTPPSPEYMRDVLGLRNIEIVSPKTPFPTSEQYRYHFTNNINLSYANREFLKNQVISTVEEIVSKSSGKTMIVVPNYQMASWFSHLPYTITEDRRTAISEVEPFRTLVVNAHGKFTEGVEFSRNGLSQLSTIVIVGVPYPNVSDPFFVDMLEYVSKGDRKKKWRVLEEYARVRTFQAIGRAVRGPEDQVDVYMVDDRFRRMGWTYPGKQDSS
ncbi:MAG: helicase C-terminal domain-containing protein [Thermoprotei archaeon]